MTACSKTASKAWRKILISSSIFSFLMPISALIYSGSWMATYIDSTNMYAGVEAAGAAIGGGLITGMMGFIGFFLGVIFLVIGLLIGKDKEIIYIEKQPQSNDESS